MVIYTKTEKFLMVCSIILTFIVDTVKCGALLILPLIYFALKKIESYTFLQAFEVSFYGALCLGAFYAVSAEIMRGNFRENCDKVIIEWRKTQEKKDKD